MRNPHRSGIGFPRVECPECDELGLPAQLYATIHAVRVVDVVLPGRNHRAVLHRRYLTWRRADYDVESVVVGCSPGRSGKSLDKLGEAIPWMNCRFAGVANA